MYKGEQGKFPAVVDLVKKVNPAGRPADVDEVGNSKHTEGQKQSCFMSETYADLMPFCVRHCVSVQSCCELCQWDWVGTGRRNDCRSNDNIGISRAL